MMHLGGPAPRRRQDVLRLRRAPAAPAGVADGGARAGLSRRLPAQRPPRPAPRRGGPASPRDSRPPKAWGPRGCFFLAQPKSRMLRAAAEGGGAALRAAAPPRGGGCRAWIPPL